MKSRTRIGILCGGKSAEHEVSLQSAKNIVEAIDKDKYEVLLIGIDKNGRWFLNENPQFLLNADDPRTIALDRGGQAVALALGRDAEQIVSLTSAGGAWSVDVIFPVLHGPFGEDGTVQGLLKLAGIPFVGAGVLGSAAGMDKDVMKRLLRDAGLPIAHFQVLHASARESVSLDAIERDLGLPCFVKPANLGSSVGIHKAQDQAELGAALQDAFTYDDKVIVEQFIAGREIECAVLGNEDPVSSVPGEIVPRHEFYSYEAKYLDENGAALEIPAKLPEEIVKKIQELAMKTFQTVCCGGMARVDFFLRDDGEVIINELNTIPGFTKISMYPKLWEASGIKYADLIDRLIQLAIQRFKREQRLKTSFDMQP